jgi:hypothetical protein
VSRFGQSTRSRAGIQGLMVLAILILVLAVGVRGLDPKRAPLPRDVVEEGARLVEPMQFLSGGAHLRVAELDEWITSTHRASFRAARGILFRLDGCPPLMDWIERGDGQRVERLLGELRNGSREDALAALTLTFQLARAAEWTPGLRGRSQHAERLGLLLQDWLRVWGERSAADPLLSEPALASVLFYGRVMRTAWKAPVLGQNQAPYDRAKAFLSELTGIPGAKRTAFGEALEGRYARAAAGLLDEKDVLSGLDEESSVVFPALDGDCSP